MYSKYILIAGSCLLASVLARPSDLAPEKLQPTVIPIVSQSEELEPNGTYKFSYETGNGIKREEIAYEKILPKSRDASSNEGGENDEESNEIHVQQGSYSYTAPDGTVITLRYIADENGFQPIGDHLPRAPVLGSAVSASAGKSGRALKITDSLDSASVPVEVKTVEKVSEPVVSTPEEVKSAPLPVTEATAEEVKTEPVAVAEESKSDVSTPEAKEPSTESEVKEANVEVSTEVASTPAPALPTTGSEQDSNASAEQATTAPEQSVVAEVTETTSSPSASEESSPSDAVGQSTASDATNESPAEEVQQESTNAPEPASVEESSATTVSS